MANVPQNWDQFESQYKAGLKLLIEKVMPDMDKIIDQKYHDGPVPKNIPKDVLTSAFDTALENKLKNDQSFVAEFKQFINSVNNMLRQWQIPRGDMSAENRERSTAAAAPAQLKNVPWLDSDGVADPKIRDAINQNDDVNSPDANPENKLQKRYTPQMQMKMENLEAELKKTYRVEAPQYVPKNRLNNP